MNLTETLAGIAVASIFAMALSALLCPLARSLERSRSMYERAKAIEFLDRSFRAECSADHPDVDRWKRDVEATFGPGSDERFTCDVVLRRSKGVVRAMTAVCVLGDDRVELLAEYGHD